MGWLDTQAYTRLNPFLEHPAAIIASKLTGEVGIAADSALSVSTSTSAAGQLTVTALLGIPAGARRDRLMESYGGVFLPVTLQAGDETHQYWIPLRPRQDGLSGAVQLRAQVARLDADAAPVGVDELARMPADAIVASIDAADNAGRERWRDLAATVTAQHPIAQAVQLWTEQ